MLKTILVPLFGNAADKATLSVAVDLARRFDAHVEALHARPDPRAVVAIAAPGMTAALIDQMVADATEQADQRAAAARRAFDEGTGGLPAAAAPPAAAGASCLWREVEGQTAVAVETHGRLFDLIVAPHATTAEDVDAALTIEAALFDTGRPILVVPRDWTGSVATRAAVAWNGSIEAARAVADALPLLRGADDVSILSAGGRDDGVRSPGALAEALAWRGIAAATSTTEAGESVGAALLDEAARNDRDLLVMGGYGHSRLREMILGGVTRYVLGAGSLPVLLSH